MANITLNMFNADQDQNVQNFIQELQNRLPQGINIEFHNGVVVNDNTIQFPDFNIYFQEERRCHVQFFLDENYCIKPGNIDITMMQDNDWQNLLNIIRNGFQASINLMQQNDVNINQNVLNTVNAMANNHNNNAGQHNLHNANGQQNNLGSN